MKTKFCLALSALLLVAAGGGTVLANGKHYKLACFPPPPPPAAVQIVTPEDGATLLNPAGIEIYVEATHFTNSVSGVEFLAGTNSLGVVTNGVAIPWRCGPAPTYYSLTWSNVSAGSYSLTAIATDAGGNSVTSSVVDIQVVTNIPPSVRIARPKDGQNILSASNITVTAFAFDPQGSVAGVELFAGTNSLGVNENAPLLVTNCVGVFTVQHRKYDFDWTNPAPGAYTLTAVATDDGGLSTTSAPVNVNIVTNWPPKFKRWCPQNERH